MSRLVCLDKDGTLLENVPYNVDPRLMRLAPGAAQAVSALAAAGFELAVVTNQAGVARGRFPASALVDVERRLRSLCADAGGPLAGVFICPHDRGCGCRKPAPGLILRALTEVGAAAADSWVVGDILDDVEAGRRAGCRTVLVDVGNETEWLDGPLRRPDHRARSLDEAADRILSEVDR